MKQKWKVICNEAAGACLESVVQELVDKLPDTPEMYIEESAETFQDAFAWSQTPQGYAFWEWIDGLFYLEPVVSNDKQLTYLKARRNELSNWIAELDDLNKQIAELENQ